MALIITTSSNQFGFIKNRNCTATLLNLVSNIYNGIENRRLEQKLHGKVQLYKSKMSFSLQLNHNIFNDLLQIYA